MKAVDKMWYKGGMEIPPFFNCGSERGAAVKRSLLLLVLLLLPVAVNAETIRLSLADAIARAVEKNLDLQVERYNPAQQEAEYQKSRGIYNPVLTFVANYNDSSSYSASLVDNRYWTRTTQLNTGLTQLFASGATATLGFNNTYQSSDQGGMGIGMSNYWQSSLGVNVSQPLLKNFGREATELTIDGARLTKEASLERLQGKLISTVAVVRNEYFKLYSLREELEVRKVSLELARRVLQETQARVKAGVMPAMEILNAEFGMASREKELIDAERAVRDQIDVVVQLLQIQPGTTLETVEVPSKGRYEVVEQVEIMRALAHRPELKELKRGLELLELQTRVAGNRTRPDLLLSASAASAGLGNTYPQDMDRLSSAKYPTWGVGLAFSYPLGNRAAENEYRKNRLKVEQKGLEIRNQEELIANEVRSAVRAVEANFKQLDVADRGRAFAEERLRAWARKAEVGLATTKDVLDVENDLAAAKNNQIKAQVAYVNAITLLWKVTGQILEKEQIRLNLPDPDQLYAEIR